MPLNIDLQQILLHVFNFVILYFGLYFILYKPVKKYMDKRQDEYAKMDEEAKKNLAEAQEKNAEYEAILAGADKEIAEKRKAAAAEMDHAREESEAEAKVAADEIIKNAKKQAVTEKEKILKDAQKEITGLVEAATRKIMLKSDSDNVYEEFLSDAERSVKDGKESV